MIANCLESIINQISKPLEVLIIDNTSTDDTIGIVKQYANHEVFIKWISEPDMGIYEAMNKGIRMAKGDWLYFMGSDDKLATETILKEVFKDEYTNNDVIYGNVFSLNSNSIYDGEFTYDRLFEKNICHQAIFFKKKIFHKTGLFNLKYKVHADWDHNLKWFSDPGVKKLYINKVISVYGAGGLSSTIGDDIFTSVKQWKYLTHNRKIISFLNKLRMAKALLKTMHRNRMRLEMTKMLIQLPIFLFF
jgi:glycosyltransferase involved in cell wall biosynthesis